MRDIKTALTLRYDFEAIGEGRLPSRFCVTDLATHAIGAVGSAVASLMETQGFAPNGPVIVDRRLASLWFGQSIKPIGWEMPPVWDAIAGDYRTRDGWIKLHTNLPHHRKAACDVLGIEAKRNAVETAVKDLHKDDLEAAIVAAGGVAAAMHSRAEWSAHPQGEGVAKEPLVIWGAPRHILIKQPFGAPRRPLDRLRVLDLTRVLAGPVATRTLAGLGADVLRIDPPGWEEANVAPDITAGKRCARLDLTATRDRETFARLISEADIFIHGYRPGALDGLGFDEAWRDAIAPNRIEVCLNAYGWSGPWAGRRGFDSLVQMSSGLAEAGMAWADKDTPTPLPVQALDHATGYLMAAAAIKSLSDALSGKPVSSAKLSLARSAELLSAHEEETSKDDTIVGPQAKDFSDDIEQTPWGQAKRLRSPLVIGDVALKWATPACEFGSALPAWS